jgi:dGTPase
VRPFGERWRAPYACDPRSSRGRLYPEAVSPTRSEFQRDRDRIIHSSAFRRLKHKTQVFVYHEGDHFRTRLTHTIEVSQIARALARSLGLDEDLAEALALSHDLGHTPFGHTGEDTLDDCMAAFGGFDHNAQALRIVTRLERRYAEYDGLNLAWETLEGLVKHNGPLLDRLATYAAGEAQCAAIADDIAYDAHDLDDGLRAGLFSIEDLRDVPFLNELLREVEGRYPGLETSRRIHELTRRVITRFVEDVVVEGDRRLSDRAPALADDIRAADRPMICFSDDMRAADASIKQFLYPHMYHHPELMRVRRQADDILRDLFRRFMAEPSAMPDEWRANLDLGDEPRLARRVADYIGGMTDRFALLEHQRLFDVTPDLR